MEKYYALVRDVLRAGFKSRRKQVAACNARERRPA